MSKHSLKIVWSEEDNGYIATVPELEGLSAFGNTYEEAARELSVAKELYLEIMREDGEEIPEPEILKPYSGQIRLRMPKRLHESLSEKAKEEGVSLNMLIVHLLSERHIYRELKKELAMLRNEISVLESESVTMARGITLIASSELSDDWVYQEEESDLVIYDNQIH